MKRIFIIFAAISMVFTTVAGCQVSPERGVVVSKNNGEFESRADIRATENERNDSGPMRYTENFESTDGSVTFAVDIDQSRVGQAMPVVEVVPHSLTSEEMEHVARVLLGDVPFYEMDPSTKTQHSKSELQEIIRTLSEYGNMNALTDLMGIGGADLYLEYVKLYLDNYTKELETAPKENPHDPCDWTLKKERVYMDDQEYDIGSRLIQDDYDVLYANAKANGVEYTYQVFTHNQYKINKICLQLTSGRGLIPVEDAIYRARLCRTSAPTEEQLNAIQEKAQGMLDQIGLGQWKVSVPSVHTSNIGSAPEYVIRVTAVPILNGVPAIEGQQVNWVEANREIYNISAVTADFSANGDIIYFDLTSPMDIQRVRNESVATLSFKDLIERSKEHLALSDAGNYGMSSSSRKEVEDHFQERVLCKVFVNQLEYSLGRMKAPGENDVYYYVPVFVLKGRVDYLGESSGTVYYSSDSSENFDSALLCINAVDGSIIER